MVNNREIVGEKLSVSKNKKLVSKKRQTAGKEGYENRQAFLQKAKEYEDIMLKRP